MSNKKVKFNDDGTTQTIYQEISIENGRAYDGSSEHAAVGLSASSTVSAGAKRLEKSLKRKKRKFEKLNLIENVYLKEKFGGGGAGEGGVEGKGDTLDTSREKNAELAENTTESTDTVVAAIAGPAGPTSAVAESKAKTAALQYLDTFIKEKANWKFQKVRQVWILQNMYFSKQMDNDQFKDCLLYLKGMGDKLKKKTVEEAKEILANAEGKSANNIQIEDAEQLETAKHESSTSEHIQQQQSQQLADTTKKRCKKIIKML